MREKERGGGREGGREGEGEREEEKMRKSKRESERDRQTDRDEDITQIRNRQYTGFRSILMKQLQNYADRHACQLTTQWPPAVHKD